jgi:hypothetical protein
MATSHAIGSTRGARIRLVIARGFRRDDTRGSRNFCTCHGSVTRSSDVFAAGTDGLIDHRVAVAGIAAMSNKGSYNSVVRDHDG